MRALLFAYYFPPLGGMGSLRALGLARHLPEAGIDVTVISPRTGTYGHDPSLVLPEGLRVLRTGTLEPGVLLRRLRGTRDGGAPHGGTIARRRGPPGPLRSLVWKLLHVPDSNVGWVPMAVAAGLEEGRRHRPHVILSTSPPLSAHLAAGRCATRLGVPFVPDFRDSVFAQRFFSRGLRRLLDERLEEMVLRRARGLVAATWGVVRPLKTRTRAPAIILRNGYDEDDFAGPEPPPHEGPFRLVHVGTTYSERRDVRPLLRAARELADGGETLRIRFVGVTDAGILDAARETGAEGVCEFRGFVSHAEAVREMRRASALLHVAWSTAEDPGIFSGRTLEYLRAGRPILGVGPADMEAHRFLLDRGARVVESDDREGLAGAIRALLAGEGFAPVPPRELLPWSRRAEAARLAEWLERLVPWPG